MHALLPDWPLLLGFVTASLLLAVTPGPGVLYIVTRSLSQGRHAGLASVGGVALGNLLNALGAVFGLAALFAVSSTAFLPQFMDPAGHPMLQGVVLGMLFVLIAAATDAIYAVLAGTLGPALSQRRSTQRLGRWLSGATFIGLGAFAAFGNPAARRTPAIP